MMPWGQSGNSTGRLPASEVVGDRGHGLAQGLEGPAAEGVDGHLGLAHAGGDFADRLALQIAEAHDFALLVGEPSEAGEDRGGGRASGDATARGGVGGGQAGGQVRIRSSGIGGRLGLAGDIAFLTLEGSLHVFQLVEGDSFLLQRVPFVLYFPVESARASFALAMFAFTSFFD